MAGIVWWTEERREALKELIVDKDLTYREAAPVISEMFGREVSERACRQQGQIMRLITSSRPAEYRKRERA
ncbi:MAG: hypothetical protein WDA41_10565 [Candidatus Neomarinimicrobiota bacterium]